MTTDEVEDPFTLPIDEESSFELNEQWSSSQLEDYERINSHLGNPVYDVSFKKYIMDTDSKNPTRHIQMNIRQTKVMVFATHQESSIFNLLRTFRCHSSTTDTQL